MADKCKIALASDFGKSQYGVMAHADIPSGLCVDLLEKAFFVCIKSVFTADFTDRTTKISPAESFSKIYSLCTKR